MPEDRRPQTKEVEEARADVERLARQNSAANESWSKAVRWTKFMKKVQGERDQARQERDRLRACLMLIAEQALPKGYDTDDTANFARRAAEGPTPEEGE